MMLLQFQLTNTSKEEKEIMLEFGDWLCEQIYSDINTYINRRKIQLKIPYLYQVNWISWANSKYIDTEMIMNSIHTSLIAKPQRNNICKLIIDNNVLIPNTYTSIDKLIRFLNFGDTIYKGSGMFTTIIHKYNNKKLNNLWKIFATRELGIMSRGEIISE